MSSKLLSWLLFLGTAVMVVIVWKIVTASPGAVWIGVALFMVAFFVVLGIAINGEPLGALISAGGRRASPSGPCGRRCSPGPR